ncbi:MAG: AbrB/MazE/SpoVT family DNA-binding domain-containing protein [Gammaproteobacteria bacterium]|nr:AbrB/MazE/SpoVT family DNA-binding domain-containing protein [Gammaproteobacteria bacterium]
MDPIESRITSQGQVSIPVRVRRKLGLAPGSKIEWCEHGDAVVVRRASTFTSQDIHHAVFSDSPRHRTVEDMDNGIREHIRSRHARG